MCRVVVVVVFACGGGHVGVRCGDRDGGCVGGDRGGCSSGGGSVCGGIVVGMVSCGCCVVVCRASGLGGRVWVVWPVAWRGVRV